MTAQGEIVVDASVVVDFVLGASTAAAIGDRIDGAVLYAPAHLDAEVLSAIGRLHRAGVLSARVASERLDEALDLPIQRRSVDSLVRGAWRRRARVRLADGLYVELAEQLEVPLVTTAARLRRATRLAEVVAP